MPPERSKSTLPILFSIIVIDVIGFGIVIPVLPFYADEYGASGFVLGALFTCHAAMQALFAPAWGRLADRIGRRPVMLCTILGTSGALLMLGLADSLAQLFLARILSGIFAANISVATAYITDVTADDERTRWMGMVGACFGVGFILGPVIGGPLAAIYGYSVPMYVGAALAAANFLHALFALKEPESHREAGPGALPVGRVLASPTVRNLCITYFLFTFAVAQLETIFAYFMKDDFDYGVMGVTMVLVAMAVVMAGIQGGGIRPLVARYGERKLLVFGVGVMAVSFAVMPFAPAVGLLMVPLFGSAIGRAVSQPSMLGLVSFEASAETRGAVMGTFQSSASIARVLGPLAAGALYDQHHAAPFLLASALLLASLVSNAGRSRAPERVAEAG